MGLLRNVKPLESRRDGVPSRPFVVTAIAVTVISFAFRPMQSIADKQICGTWIFRHDDSLETRLKVFSNKRWESRLYHRRDEKSADFSPAGPYPSTQGTWRRDGAKLYFVENPSGRDLAYMLLTFDLGQLASSYPETNYTIL